MGVRSYGMSNPFEHPLPVNVAARMLPRIPFGDHLARAMPWLVSGCVAVLAALLVGTLFVTGEPARSLPFLAGVLTAASLALASRHSTLSSNLARQTTALGDMRRVAEGETSRRARVERDLKAAQPADHYLGDVLPAMVSYIDPERRIVFHNKAYRQWVGRPADRLLGCTLAEVFGRSAYAEMKGALDEAFLGRVVRYERRQRMGDGQVCNLLGICLPHPGERGAVAGVFVILVDVTGKGDLEIPAGATGAERAAYTESLARDLTPWNDVGERLAVALQRDEFILFAQPLQDLSPRPGGAPFHEILIRLREEEENLMPPGAFLPLAESHGLMPDLDLWVVTHLLGWASADPKRCAGTFSINMSRASICDAKFANSVAAELRRRRGHGPKLCFEFDNGDALLDFTATQEFMRQMQAEGCEFALSGFAGDPMSFKVLAQLRPDYLKIDGGIIVGMSHSAIERAKVKAIAVAARAMHVQTIAQCVEDAAALQALRSAGVDFAQGFFVGRPAPLPSFFARA